MTNSAQIHGIKFQPMPKRFMVWNKCEQRFHRLRSEEGSWKYVFDIWEAQCLLERLDQTEVIICQSTNLFDKDGKEIFEGGIVRRAWECARDDEDAPLFLVIWSPDRAEFAFKYGIFHNGVEQIIDKKALRDVKVIGHILSNPELMEEKDV